MSAQITEAFVKEYKKNLLFLSQQHGSRLRSFVDLEKMVKSESYIERLGPVTATPLVGRHQDTPQADTPHSRRKLTTVPYANSDFIDIADKKRILIDPTSGYMKNFSMAYGRAMDDVILTAASGNAYAGADGTTAVPLPNSQKLASVKAGAGSRFNLDTLLRLKKKFDKAEVEGRRNIALDAEQIEALLGEVEIKSADYNTVKALVRGDIDSFLGFNFIRTERVLAQAGALSFDVNTGEVGTGAGDADTFTKVIAWADGGLTLGLNEDITGRISERDDKNYLTQVYARMDIGATRVEEARVVEVLCKSAI